MLSTPTIEKGYTGRVIDYRVSVIVPLFNKRSSVDRAITSISQQTTAPGEIIVVDDGSTDGSGDVVRSLNVPRLRLVRQCNSGPGAARNRGICESNGELLAFLDADDSWQSTYIAEGVATLERYREAAAVTSCYVDQPGYRCQKAFWKERGLPEGLVRVGSELDPLVFTHMVAYMTPCTTIVRRSTVSKYCGFYDQNCCRYAEDATLWTKVLLNETVYFNLLPLVELDRSKSGLSARGSLHPLEPFLADPAELERFCQPELRPLLQEYLKIRACKSAAILGYWGRSDAARALMRRYIHLQDWRTPYFWLGVLGSTAASGPLGCMARSLSRLAGLSIAPRLRSWLRMNSYSPCRPGSACRSC